MVAGLWNGYHLGWATAKSYSGITDGARAGYELADRWWKNPVRPDVTRSAVSVPPLAVMTGESDMRDSVSCTRRRRRVLVAPIPNNYPWICSASPVSQLAWNTPVVSIRLYVCAPK